jgi:hypothetical protein
MIPRKRERAEQVIVHIDMDCFYVQVEDGLDTSLKGIPCAGECIAQHRTAQHSIA